MRSASAQCYVTVISDPNGVFVREPAEHSHPVDPLLVRKLQRKRALLETAIAGVRSAPDKRLKRLVKDKNISEEVVAELNLVSSPNGPEYQTSRNNKSAINYHRRKLLAGNQNGATTAATSSTIEPATSSTALSTSASASAAPFQQTFNGLEEMKIGGMASSSSASVSFPFRRYNLEELGTNHILNLNQLELLAQASHKNRVHKTRCLQLQFHCR